MSESYQLVMKKGPGPGQVFSLEKEEILIGRDIQCDISVIEASLSRRHARLFLKDGQFYIEDLNSTNGTFLNETRIDSPQPVPVDGLINLGGNLVFALEPFRQESLETAVFSRDLLQTVVPTADATKVFISYSRKNQPFVEKLHAGLTRSGINTWVDWEGIPLTADWWAEIEDAIEGADGFVFVISPDSLASEVCGRELRAAIDRQKRLIPVLHIDPGKGAGIPDQISSHNWVFMQDQGELEKNLPDLVASLNTDLNWVRSHTRLMVRAAEWERQAKNSSFLLQGDDLQNAESWLEKAGANQPKPTSLHIEYIQASRRAANRRQRTVVTASLVALGITLVLAVISFTLYLNANSARAEALDQKATAEVAEAEAVNQAATAEAAKADAENQAATAEAARILAQNQEATAVAAQGRAEAAEEDAVRQAEKARAGEVAATGWGLVDSNPPLAALLALESLRIEPDNVTAQRVLSEIPTVYPPLVGAYSDPETWLAAAAWSSTGLMAIASGEVNRITIWDVETDEQLVELSGSAADITALAWSEDGRLASGDDFGEIILWDLETGEPESVLPVFQKDIRDLAWSQRGRLASASSDGTIALWDFPASEPQILEYGDSVSAVAWSVFGQLASASSDGNVSIWNVASGALDQVYSDHQSGVMSVAWAPDGSLASGSQDSTIVVRNPSGNFRVRLEGHTDYVNEVAWSADGRLASASWDSTVILWDLEKAAPLQILRGHNGPVDMLAWGPDGELASGSSEFLFLWDMDRDASLTVLSGHLDWNDSVAWTPDGSLISGGFDGTAIFWDVANKEALGTFYYDDCGLGVSPDGRLMIGGLIIDPDFPEQYFLNGCNLRLSPSGDRAVGLDETGEVAVWDLDPMFSTGQVISRTLYAPDAAIADMDWSPDGTMVAVARDDGLVDVLDSDSGALVQLLDGHDSLVYAVAWGQDGNLATGDDGGMVILWDSQTLQQGEALADLGGVVQSLAWSPDGQLAIAVSGENEGRIIIWDVQGGQAQSTISTPFQSPFALAWNPDGSKLAFAGTSYNIYIFDTYYAQHPCTWLARNMTEWEWELYFPGEPYNQTCP